MLIGETPYKQDNYRQQAFAGPAGKELGMQYLISAGLTRRDVILTYAMSCSLPRYRNPQPEEVITCAEERLQEQIYYYRPSVICPMGAVACSLVEREPRINIEIEHGIPFQGSMWAWSGTILPLYSPGAGISQAGAMIALQQDFPVIDLILNHNLRSHPETDTVKQDYKTITTKAELVSDLTEHNGTVSIDTETDCQGFNLDPINDPPYMLSYSLRAGHGRVIRIADKALLTKFNRWIQEVRPMVIMHNALFDKLVLERMGVFVPWTRIHDTMESAYISGYLPQGLKALGYRLLNIKMNNYDDVVTPYAQARQAQYLGRLAVAKPSDVPQPYLGPRQHKLPRKAMAALLAWEEKGVNLQDRWKGWYKEREQDIWVAENALGKFPYSSIRFAPAELSEYYAAQDADVTFRIKSRLVSILGNTRSRK